MESKANIIESLLFVSAKALSLAKIKEVLEGTSGAVTDEDIQTIIDGLVEKYKDDAYSWQLIRVAGGYQLVTKRVFTPWIKKMYKSRFTIRLSVSALETLSIIAYRQPITKADVDDIRGVDSVGVINTLLARKLIRISGYKEAPRKPPEYSTTSEFLRYFGLNSLDELPLPEHIRIEEEPQVEEGALEEQDDVVILENRMEQGEVKTIAGESEDNETENNLNDLPDVADNELQQSVVLEDTDSDESLNDVQKPGKTGGAITDENKSDSSED